LAEIQSGKLVLNAMVGRPDGSEILRSRAKAAIRKQLERDGRRPSSAKAGCHPARHLRQRHRHPATAMKAEHDDQEKDQ